MHTPLFILIYKGENDVHERIAPLQIILLTACKNSLCITNKNTNENIWQCQFKKFSICDTMIMSVGTDKNLDNLFPFTNTVVKLLHYYFCKSLLFLRGDIMNNIWFDYIQKA